MSRFTLQVSHLALALAAWWPAALAAAPAASPATSAPAVARPPALPLRLPPPTVYERTVGADSAVTFSHETHVALANDRCTGCHPKPFRMLRPARRIVHADMESGGSCGLCHDGRSAFGVTDPSACQTCHAGSAKASLAAAPIPPGGTQASPARRVPGPVRFTRGESSPGPVRFRHETHAEGGCKSCHPKPYAMRSTGGAPGGAMHASASCGGCHDGRRAFGVEDADACGRCHRDQESRP